MLVIKNLAVPWVLSGTGEIVPPPGYAEQVQLCFTEP